MPDDVWKPESSQASSKKMDIQERKVLMFAGNSRVMVPMMPML